MVHNTLQHSVYIPRAFKIQQDRQCTYNITIMCVRVTNVAVEKQQALNITIVSVFLP
jgi:hypothetical protein